MGISFNFGILFAISCGSPKCEFKCIRKEVVGDVWSE